VVIHTGSAQGLLRVGQERASAHSIGMILLMTHIRIPTLVKLEEEEVVVQILEAAEVAVINLILLPLVK
jgi:hypothetical protein